MEINEKLLKGNQKEVILLVCEGRIIGFQDDERGRVFVGDWVYVVNVDEIKAVGTRRGFQKIPKGTIGRLGGLDFHPNGTELMVEIDWHLGPMAEDIFSHVHSFFSEEEKQGGPWFWASPLDRVAWPVQYPLDTRVFPEPEPLHFGQPGETDEFIGRPEIFPGNPPLPEGWGEKKR